MNKFVPVVILTLVIATISIRATQAGYKHPCRNCTPSVSVTPSLTTSLTPSVTPTPSEEPKQEQPLTPAGAPQGPRCEPLIVKSTIAWVSQDRKDWSWTTVEPYVTHWILEYEVNGKVYTTTSNAPNFHFNESVSRLRVSSSHNGCQGPWSDWNKNSPPTGSK